MLIFRECSGCGIRFFHGSWALRFWLELALRRHSQRLLTAESSCECHPYFLSAVFSVYEPHRLPPQIHALVQAGTCGPIAAFSANKFVCSAMSWMTVSEDEIFVHHLRVLIPRCSLLILPARPATELAAALTICWALALVSACLAESAAWLALLEISCAVVVISVIAVATSFSFFKLTCCNFINLRSTRRHAGGLGYNLLANITKYFGMMVCRLATKALKFSLGVWWTLRFEMFHTSRATASPLAKAPIEPIKLFERLHDSTVHGDKENRHYKCNQTAENRDSSQGTLQRHIRTISAQRRCRQCKNPYRALNPTATKIEYWAFAELQIDPVLESSKWWIHLIFEFWWGRRLDSCLFILKVVVVFTYTITVLANNNSNAFWVI